MILISALEIFSNPYDLEFILGEDQEKKDGTFCLAVTRGPGHNFKIMLTGAGCKTKGDAIVVIKQILDVSFSKGREIFFKEPFGITEKLVQTVGNPGECKEEDAKNSLTQKMINKILIELDEKGSVSTYTQKWHAVFAA